MDAYKFDVVRKNTQRQYKQIYMKHIFPTLGKKYLQKITQLEIRLLLKKLKQDGFGYETQSKVKILLSDMFNKAMIDEFVRRNPVRGISIKRDEKKRAQDVNCR